MCSRITYMEQTIWYAYALTEGCCCKMDLKEISVGCGLELPGARYGPVTVMKLQVT
jgi:hypothetical protein